MTRWPPFEDVATFAVAVIVLIGAFYGLLRNDSATGAESRVIFGGLIATVATFYFQRAATKAATAHTIEAQNNGLDVIRQTVGRIEDGRIPTEAERIKREHRS